MLRGELGGEGLQRGGPAHLKKEEEDCLVVINPSDGKWTLFFSLYARVLCLHPDRCRGLYFHYCLQVSHSVLRRIVVGEEQGEDSPPWLSATGASWTACEA